MKKLKVLLCIVIIAICLQVTYSRFITQFPNGSISATTGKAIVNLNYIGIHSEEYNGRPSLLDSTKEIIYDFSVSNYTSSTSISNVDLNASIYIVFYDASNNVISSRVDCVLRTDSGVEVTQTELSQAISLTVNNENVSLPVGTLKFSTPETLTKNVQETNVYHLHITPNVDNLPTSEIIANMKIYCSAEQPV